MRGPLTVCGSREDQVFEQLMDGKSEKEIAVYLGLSPHTVHVYVKSLYRRYDVGSRPELMAKCFKAAIAMLRTTDHGRGNTEHPRFVG